MFDLINRYWGIIGNNNNNNKNYSSLDKSTRIYYGEIMYP